MTRARDKASAVVASFTSTGIDDNADANAITIDSSERVGIGTTSPVALLTTVAADGVMADQYVAKFTNSEATAGQNYGVFVAGGSTSADESFSVRKFDNSATYLKVRGDGVITMPSQPAFQVHKNGTEQSNIPADNSTVAVTFSTEAFDLGGNFASNTFTAPVTGKYLMALKLRFNNADTASQYYIARVITSNSEYHNIYDSDDDAGGDLEFLTLQVTQLVDMDANDTATVGVTQQGGTQQTDINGGRVYTSFSGYLVA